MRLRPFALLFAFCLANAAPSASAQEPITDEAVISAIEEYVLAKYAGDVEGVRARAHHDIARAVVTDRYWGQPSPEWIRRFSHDHLQYYGTGYSQTRLEDPSTGRLDVEIFDLEQKSASARVVMDDVVDYLHLVNFDGRWLIADSAVILLPEPGAAVPAQDRTDEDEIEELVRDYAMGFYEIDGAKVQNTCHPSLSKRTVDRRENTAFDVFSSISWEEIAILGNTFNRHWGFDPATARAEIEVYEIREGVAAAKLTGTVWFDYFHVMRVNDEWKIVNIVYESLPQERWDPPAAG